MSKANIRDNVYVGRIASVPGGVGDFGFIGIQTVTKENGEAVSISQNDIFIHQDDCQPKLRVGMEIQFCIGPDHKRGAGFLRASSATEIVDGELVPANEDAIPGFLALVPTAGNYITGVEAKTKYHLVPKIVPPETVSKVEENEPLPTVPRDSRRGLTEEEVRELVTALLQSIFPELAHFSANFDALEQSDEELDEVVAENEDDLREIGMEQEIQKVQEKVTAFKSVKKSFRFLIDNNLVRPDTIIPIENLPDLFMAVPVWYFWTNPEDVDRIEEVWRNSDPHPQDEIRYFCDLFPNKVWGDTYQMFNRRVRSLRMYSGDTVPRIVSKRMRAAVEEFDYIVVATPYHKEAGSDWENLSWLQMIDPYVLGFKKGVPYFFVLARFSDTGTLPLFKELVGDTIEFLKTNKEKLNGFNLVSSPYWYHPHAPELISASYLGDRLISHTTKLLERFEEGDLFDWLRKGEKKESEQKSSNGARYDTIYDNPRFADSDEL